MRRKCSAGYIFYFKKEEDTYQAAVNVLTEHFSPIINLPYERHLFRVTSQKRDETVDQFVTRLRQKAETCSFDNLEERIVEQVIEQCASERLRLKFLKAGKTLTLQTLQEMARIDEAAQMPASAIANHQEDRQTVNKLSRISFYSGDKNQRSTVTSRKCYRCGKVVHIAADMGCPAKRQRCRKCNNVGHFAACCKTKMANQSKPAPRKVPQRGYQVNMMESSNEVPDSRESDDYIFGLKCRDLNTQINVFVGDTKIPMMVDSGSSCNVIDKILWSKFKTTCSEPVRLYDVDRNIYAYGSENPLKILGAFKSDVSWGETRLKNVEFVVYDGNSTSLLGNQTATQLGVLKILNDSEVNAVEMANDILTDYSACFEGFGKLKDFELKLPVNDTISPVCQPLRRIPFNLRDKLTEKLNELESLDIIEKVNGPTNWVSPVIIVPKANNDIRLCVDMRRANTAITRVRYPIPTIGIRTRALKTRALKDTSPKNTIPNGHES